MLKGVSPMVILKAMVPTPGIVTSKHKLGDNSFCRYISKTAVLFT
jgi:hypothetical protein